MTIYQIMYVVCAGLGCISGLLERNYETAFWAALSVVWCLSSNQ